MPKCISLAALLAFATLASSCSRPTAQMQPAASPNQRAAEVAIRNIDVDWAKAATAKDVSKFVSFYAADATLLPPGGSITTGRQAIAEAWQRIVAQPGFSLTLAPTKIVVSRSGDLAYELGDYALTANDQSGRPQTAKGKYIVVWGKQADGTWKALVDAPTTTR